MPKFVHAAKVDGVEGGFIGEYAAIGRAEPNRQSGCRGGGA